MFLNGNFVALDIFKAKYGVQLSDGSYAIPTKWQSALFQSGQCGAFVGVFLAGPVTTRLGYRWTTILALILMNATIFISFFVSPRAMVCSSPPLTLRRQTRLKFWSSDRRSKACHGAFSSPIRPPMPVRLFHFPFEGLSLPLCK